MSFQTITTRRRGTTVNWTSRNGAPDSPDSIDDLRTAKEDYQLVEYVHGLPSHVKTLPKKEKFSLFEYFRIRGLLLVLAIGYAIDRFFTRAWKKLPDLFNVYGLIFRKPSTAEIWRDDAFFARQRLTGVNPFVIELCKELPKKMTENLNIREASLKTVLQQRSGRADFTLETAIQENRLFIVNYTILDGMFSQFGVCAPIALFLVDANKELMPIAIQLHQSGESNPLFLPNDPSWLMAKLWFNHADSSFQESFSHLGVTHLLMESVDVVTHQNLAPSHPVFEILAPHFHYLLAINTEARSLLINKNGIVDKTLSIGRDGMIEIIRRRLVEWRMDTDGILPTDLKKRGVIDDGILPGYYYRDDALLVYEAIHKYVKTCVEIHYDDYGNNGRHRVSDDTQLQNWVLAIISKREPVGGGCEIQGLPMDDNGETISTCGQLIEIVTCIIYICSVRHAVTNFPQYDQYGFQPAYPVGMRGTPPQDPKAELTATAIINAIPPKVTCLLEMLIMKFLSTRNTKLLGNFDKDIIPFPCDAAVTQFQKDLHEIAEKIEERNKIRKYPYQWASPDYIPNSISI
ncbi:polyunsaturated fatty acid 5-lipoxygenase-like [Ylistrum balloti]|uniref:polyunsaturated fatty acid 5-lipoxygenase-like n=1 Tax=Ylistrum balloti TaxID=509963 RepID=UPI002905EB4F|nr:polyunsaturated fatty acid 5-lipoxygenase-like [Ylistrum balloti]